MTHQERIDKLRHVSIQGEFRSVGGLQQMAEQFQQTAYDCDSAAHECAAITMRWAAERIVQLERKLLDISNSIKVIAGRDE